MIALKIAASSIVGLRAALSIFESHLSPASKLLDGQTWNNLIVSKLSNALICVTFFAQLSVLVRYMIKTEQCQLEVTIANVAIESLLLASELYLC